MHKCLRRGKRGFAYGGAVTPWRARKAKIVS
jgi:hypothetical protein